MPRAFSEIEKERIKKNLIEEGTDFFGRYGLKKTNIEELTRAAGIAKGSFYIFYDSKEELYWEILERFEKEFRDTAVRELLAAPESPQAILKKLIKYQLDIMENNPILKILFDREEFNLLTRKIPEAKLTEHTENDIGLMSRILLKWRNAGLLIEKDLRIISGLIKATFLLSLHKDIIGPDIYPAVIELLADLVSEGLIKGGKND